MCPPQASPCFRFSPPGFLSPEALLPNTRVPTRRGSLGRLWCANLQLPGETRDHPHRFPGWWESCFPRRRTRKLDFKVLKIACLPGHPMFKTKGPPLAGSLLLPKSSNEVDVSKFEECVVFLYCGGVARIPRDLFFPCPESNFLREDFLLLFLVDFIDVLG